ncbi:MAG: hypothetical protein IPL61_35380 [Myxococcales bacterium]|nr:hypothetical protein [Myxococcales bacterium]
MIRWQGDTAKIILDVPDYRQTDATITSRIDAGNGDAPLVMRIEGARLPAGATMSAGGVTVPASGGLIQLAVPVADVGAISIDALTRSVELAASTPIEVALEGQAPVSTAVPAATVDLGFPLMDAFALVRRGPVRFTTADTRLDTAVLIGQSMMHEVVGPGRTLADIDWVVDQTRRQTSRRKRCSGYSGGVGTVTIAFVDTVLTIYEVRTGKQVGVEVVSPPARCPSFVRLSGGEAQVGVYTDDVKRRVQALLARGSARRAR